jgi:hypothetical protein
MAEEEKTKLRLEIGHVLFIDLVGYSKLLIEEQKERMRELNDIVLATAQVDKATNEKLVRLPTGDGMALVFRNSSEEPAQCALEIARALKDHPKIEVRMGIHSNDKANAYFAECMGGLFGPPLTPTLLRLDPDWDNLRDDPRFQKLCEDKSK